MKIPIVDTHAHLCSESFADDRAEVIRRAEQAGVSSIILVGETLEDAKANIRLAGDYACLKASAGLYPEYASLESVAEMIDFMRLNKEQLCAIGEVGLDFWVAKEEQEREQQREVFSQFIRFAGKSCLPLNVHSRSAGRHAVSMLLENNAKQVQMHAFDGKASAAMPAVEAGYFFSVPPSIVRSRQKQKLLKHLPLSCLLVESDSPVLGPDPEIRNEPANVVIAIDAIAEIKEISTEMVIEAVWENSCKLYSLAQDK